MSNYAVFTPEGMAPDEGALEQMRTCMADPRAVKGALMADHHRGYSMPIGGVIAYDGAISPSAVGFDIACGNKAVRTDLSVIDLHPSLVKPLMRDIQRKLEFGIGRKNASPIDHPLFDAPAWEFLEKHSPGLKKKAHEQLGTIGSGNHYVDVLVDEDSRVWVACHFGSRGFGHTVATTYLNLAAGNKPGDRLVESETPCLIPTAHALGWEYVSAMHLAGEYAYAGRNYVIETVLGILGAEADMSVHNHHNFAWFEDGLWVHRKGATPLTSTPAFIGGSMGDASVIVQGLGLASGTDSHIASAPHGAGRVMSRTKAAGKWKHVKVNGRRERVRDGNGLVDWDAVRADLNERGVVVLGGGADEAPAVYKRLSDVISAHRSTLSITHVLSPIGVVMAGDDIHDPYKD